MNTIQQALSSKRTLKKFLLECDFTFLSTLHEQITATLTERKAEHNWMLENLSNRFLFTLDLMV